MAELAELEKSYGETHEKLLGVLDTVAKDGTPENVKVLSDLATVYRESHAKLNDARKAAKAEADKKNAPPAEYKFELPKDALVPQAYVDEFTKWAKDNKLSQESATQTLLRDNLTLKKFVDLRTADFQAKLKDGGAAIEKHPVLGGANLAATNERVTALIEKMGSKELMEEFQQLGLNHSVKAMEFLDKIAREYTPEKLGLKDQRIGGEEKPGEVPGPDKPPAGFFSKGEARLKAEAAAKGK